MFETICRYLQWSKRTPVYKIIINSYVYVCTMFNIFQICIDSFQDFIMYRDKCSQRNSKILMKINSYLANQPWWLLVDHKLRACHSCCLSWLLCWCDGYVLYWTFKFCASINFVLWLDTVGKHSIHALAKAGNLCLVSLLVIVIIGPYCLCT